MYRNVYGMEPSTGKYHRAEGGVVISMPHQDPTQVYSGNRDNKNRWIKKNAIRYDNIRPDHIPGVFFPVPGRHTHNVRQVTSNDYQMWVMPWDHKFQDNAGYYAVYVLLSKTKPTLFSYPPVQ